MLLRNRYRGDARGAVSLYLSISPRSHTIVGEAVRITRKKVLHLWSEAHSSLEDDAVKTFDHTIECVLNFFPQHFDKG